MNLLLALLAAATPAAALPPDIAAFNRALTDATLRMDHAALLALWEDDGVSLLPETAPIQGKKALAGFLDGIAKTIPGAKVTRQEDDCHDAEVAGDWASEWCYTHQVVDLGEGRAPWEGRGRMLLVLHRGPDGRWRIRREMWNAAVRTAPPPPPPASP